MEITKQMVEEYAMHHDIDLTDGSQEPGIIGTLNTWADGQGELDADLVNGNPTFAPIVEAYYTAKGESVPESVKVPLTPTGKGATDVMSGKSSEADDANT
ncbi:MAG: hypothetical protein PHC53_05395 [Patescibacteria group bacterium]|nr:hypothetical protein [Patescibacteria group bacterium]